MALTMAPEPLTRYLTDHEDKAGLLGLVVFYSVEQTIVPHDELVSELTAVGLEKFKPAPPYDVDVFRRVCSAAQAKRIPTANDDVFENILVRNVVGNGGSEVLRKIVLERVDQQNRRLGYEVMANVRFDRASSGVSVKRTGKGRSDAVDQAMQFIVTEYPRQKGCVDATCVRGLINDVLVGSHAVSLRKGGGVYFAAAQHVGAVEALETLAYSLPAAQVHSIPLPDDRKQRSMLEQAFVDESRGEIERTMAAIKKLLDDGKPVAAGKVTEYLTTFRALKEKASAYTELLSTNLSATDTALDLLQRQVMTLATRSGGEAAA